jgi:hypothetical protein
MTAANRFLVLTLDATIEKLRVGHFDALVVEEWA